jgi:phage shock protein C
MSLVDDLHHLEQLHQRGGLSDDEYARAKARLLSDPATPAPAGLNRYRRTVNDRWVAGVCGGLARLTGTESWIWRLAACLLVLIAGTGVLLYLLLWIFVPAETD